METKRFFTFVKMFRSVDKSWTMELANLDLFYKTIQKAKLEDEQPAPSGFCGLLCFLCGSPVMQCKFRRAPP